MDGREGGDELARRMWYILTDLGMGVEEIGVEAPLKALESSLPFPTVPI